MERTSATATLARGYASHHRAMTAELTGDLTELKKANPHLAYRFCSKPCWKVWWTGRPEYQDERDEAGGDRPDAGEVASRSRIDIRSWAVRSGHGRAGHRPPPFARLVALEITRRGRQKFSAGTGIPREL